jgi:shikimate kinase
MPLGEKITHVQEQPNIIFIGFMGCGKTTVGRCVAEKLAWEFVDTDQLIATTSGLSITEIFSTHGEAHFRQLEKNALEHLQDSRHRVIATGGGIVTQPEIHPLLRRLGFIVWLNAAEDAIYERISRNKNRPLLQNADPRGTITALLTSRRALYADLAHLIIDTTGLDPEEIAYGICESARHHFSHR